MNPEVEPRGEWEIRWRQARNVPPPIVRAITADVLVAVVAGLVLLVWDLVAGAGLGAFALDLVVVVGAGNILTYLWAPLPTGASCVRRRSPWARHGSTPRGCESAVERADDEPRNPTDPRAATRCRSD